MEWKVLLPCLSELTPGSFLWKHNRMIFILFFLKLLSCHHLFLCNKWAHLKDVIYGLGHLWIRASRSCLSFPQLLEHTIKSDRKTSLSFLFLNKDFQLWSHPSSTVVVIRLVRWWPTHYQCANGEFRPGWSWSPEDPANISCCLEKGHKTPSLMI